MVVTLFTALIAPYFIDWTAYKNDFEQQASRILGQKVVVGGNANVRLLPLPLISFSQLSVGENLDGRPLMTVERFSANVELMPFLSGEISIVDMALESPVFNFVIDENGTIAWTDRKELLVDPDQVKLDKLTVTNASFNLSGLGLERVVSGEAINADISATSLIGPWRIRGTGQIDGQKSNFDLSTGRFSDEGSIRLKADIERLDKPYELSADGTVSLKENILSWEGKFGIQPVSDDADILRNYDVKPLPVVVDGEFVLTPTELNLPQYRIDIGSKEDPFSLTGDGFVRLKGGVDFRLNIDGRQVDLDRIAKMRSEQPVTGNTLETRIRLFGSVLAQVPVPAFKGSVDLEIPAIIAGDTYIREVSALIRPFGNGWEIVRLKSSLPGNTLLEAKGRLGKGDEFGFHGNILIASRQPSGLAAWASGDVDPAIRKLSSAGLSANITLTPSQISLDQMELILDSNRLTGRVQRLGRASGSSTATPAIVADLAGDVVRLDDLRAIASMLAGEESISLNNDFDVSLKAGQLSGFDLEATDVDIQFQYKKGQLSLARLNVKDFLGTSVTTSGQITNLLEQPRGNITIELAAGDGSLFAEAVGKRFGSLPFIRALSSDNELTSNSTLRLELDSSPVTIDGIETLRSRVLVNGSVGGSKLTLQSAFKGSLRDWQSLWIDASLEAENENGEILLRQTGLEELGFNPVAGGVDIPLKLAFETTGSGKSGYSTIVSVSNQDLTIAANGILQGDAKGKPADKFDIVVGATNISPIVSAFGYFLPEMNVVLGDEAPFSAKARLTATGERSHELKIEQAQIHGNEFSGNLQLTSETTGKQLLSGDLSLARLSLNILSGLASGHVFSNDLGEWSRSDFGAAPFFGRNANLRILAKAVDLGLGHLANDLRFDLKISDGNFAAGDIKVQWNGAEIAGNASLASENGTAILSSQFSAAKVDGAKLVQAFGIQVDFDGTGNLSGSLEGAGKSPYSLVRSISGSGVVGVSEAQLTGISHEGLGRILTNVDVEGFKINANTVAPLARNSFLAGAIALQDVTAPFSISNGNVQFRNISLTGENAGARDIPLAGFSFDLVEDAIEAEIRLFPSAGKEAVSGADPDVGFNWQGSVASLQLTVDTSSLEGYLSIRAFENEQRRVEILQASILEKQRFRYEVLRSNTRGNWLEAKRIEAEEKARAEAERLARERAELKLRLEAERLAALKAEEEARRLAEEAEEQMKLETQKLLEAEAAAKREAEKQTQERASKLEADRLAAEKAAAKQKEQQESSSQPSPGASSLTPIQPKSGFEANSLPDPATGKKPDIFRNIEDLLFNTN